MKIRKSMLAAGAVGVIGLSSLVGISAASAHFGGQGNGSDLAEKIATKFNLNQDEVEAVFEEEKAAREQERQQEQSDRLQELVDEGKLTAEQKSAIEAKRTEMKIQREADHAELEAWAEQNGIDEQYVMRHGPHGDDFLAQALEDGDITAEQKTAIEAKQAELEAKHEEARVELEAWAEQNGIDVKYVMGMRGGHGGGGGHGRGMMQ